MRDKNKTRSVKDSAVDANPTTESDTCRRRITETRAEEETKERKKEKEKKRAKRSENIKFKKNGDR